MKQWLPFLSLMLCASAVLAEPPQTPETTTQKAASALVRDKLVTPLHRSQSKRSKFSRAAPVAVQRRVRVLDATALTDARGKKFVRFAVDVRQSYDEEAAWREDAILGCAYVGEQRLYVQIGDEYLPATAMLGKNPDPNPTVCRSAEAQGEVAAL